MPKHVPNGKYPALERKVAALLAKMTLAEQVGQLVQLGSSIYAKDPDLFKRARQHLRDGLVGAILGVKQPKHINEVQKIAVEETRLGIPLIFGLDVIHGFRTTFPIPLGEAASWDVEAVRDGGIHWTFAPMVDIARDPRWGRIAEGSGEDPFLGAAMARARVQGFQGDDLGSPERLLACAKHFAAYGAAEGGRDYNSVDMSERAFRNVYLPPFLAALEAGVGTFMCAFNDLNGVPCSGNRFLLTRILREEHDFRGFVVSDAMSIGEMIAHGFAADQRDAALKAITAGLDMDMAADAYLDHLEELVAAGQVDRRLVKESARRVLRIKFMLGLFEHPYADEARGPKVFLAPAHRAAARAMARKSVVLLKNDRAILPLAKDLRRLAVIGPLADNRHDVLGTWAIASVDQDVVTVLAGIRQAVGNKTEVVHEQGCDLAAGDEPALARAVAAAKGADAVILAIGESEAMSGEAHCVTSIELTAPQQALAERVIAANPRTVVVLMAGRSLAVPWLAEHAPALLMAWHPGTECGLALADVLFGDYNPSGKLPVTVPRRTGQVPLYYNHFATGRPYREGVRWVTGYIDTPNLPLYPFGFGLSYTTFEYRSLTLSAKKLCKGKRLTAQVEVANTGKRAGAEVVQLYVQDVVASAVRPVKELKGFAKVELAPGEKRTVSFTLRMEDLGYFDADAKFVVEPGRFRVWAGPSSAEGLQAEFELV